MTDIGNINEHPSTNTADTDLLSCLQDIATSGNVTIQWFDLQQSLKSRLEQVIEMYQKEKDCNENQLDEPNVEKFNLKHIRDEMMEMIASFTEPPFTIQRICELLSWPNKYYDQVSTFLRGLEKNLRVISSNDWPKCPTTSMTTNTTLISNCVKNDRQATPTTHPTTTTQSMIIDDNKTSSSGGGDFISTSSKDTSISTSASTISTNNDDNDAELPGHEDNNNNQASALATQVEDEQVAPETQKQSSGGSSTQSEEGNEELCEEESEDVELEGQEPEQQELELEHPQQHQQQHSQEVAGDNSVSIEEAIT